MPADVQSIFWRVPVAMMIFICVQCHPMGPAYCPPEAYRPAPPRHAAAHPSQPAHGKGGTPVSALMRQVNLKVDMVAKGKYGRRVVRPMTPLYITIHSTENYTANAEKHSQALKNGALRSGMRPGGNRIGFLIWHFTVDDHMAIQHMPTTEQGEHADFDGPGNRLSIGIEMCENRWGNLGATIERTAKLTAVLMKKNHIPLRNVVPHYHWPRHGKHPPNKNCPHFLMDNGVPGAKWRGFLSKVNAYYQRLDE